MYWARLSRIGEPKALGRFYEYLLRVAFFCLLLLLMQSLFELAKLILCNLFLFVQDLLNYSATLMAEDANEGCVPVLSP